MYQTDSTNNMNSATQSKSFTGIQADLWAKEDSVYSADILLTEQVFEHYHQALKNQPKIADILLRRKIHPKFIDECRIGFADRSLGFELQSPKCLLGSQNRGRLQRLGLLLPSGHEFFRGALVIPYFDHNGQIAGAYGRRPKQQRRTQAYHLYWNAQQIVLFNATGQQFSESVILCKSAIDALALLSAGFENVVATMGISGFNEIQLTQLFENGVRRAYIAFDNTPSANHYALLVAQALASKGIQSYRIELPIGQDVNYFAALQTDVVSTFGRLVKAAVPFKQRYGDLDPVLRERWRKRFSSIDDAVTFFLEEQRSLGKASRTVDTIRVHLERFQAFCHSEAINRITDITQDTLLAYQYYLTTEKNIFTGKVISAITQVERMEAVSRMLSRLHYYGIIPELLVFECRNGLSH